MDASLLSARFFFLNMWSEFIPLMLKYACCCCCCCCMWCGLIPVSSNTWKCQIWWGHILTSFAATSMSTKSCTLMTSCIYMIHCSLNARFNSCLFLYHIKFGFPLFFNQKNCKNKIANLSHFLKGFNIYNLRLKNCAFIIFKKRYFFIL